MTMRDAKHASSVSGEQHHHANGPKMVSIGQEEQAKNKMIGVER